MAATTNSSFPAAPLTTERRAKRIGGPIQAPSYRAAKAITAHAIARAITLHASQRALAAAAGVSQRLVQAWIDPHGPNGMRLDVALAIAHDGGPSCRNVVLAVLREVLSLAERAGNDTKG